jgi:hypothetical protein
MAQGKKAIVRMTFADGSAFDEWTSIQWRDTWTDPLGDLKLEVAPARSRIFEYRDRLQKGELVTVHVNDVNQGGFLIQSVETTIDPQSGVTFSLQCHTPLVTPFEGSADPTLSFKAQTEAPVSDILLKAFAPFGFDSFVGDESASVAALTGRPIGNGRKAISIAALKADQACVQDGETVADFTKRVVTRLGVALRMSATGTLMLSAPDYDQDASYTIVQSADPSVGGDRFFGAISLSDTNENQFSECRVRGNRNDKAGSTQTSPPDATVNAADLFPNRPAYKSFAAAYKPLIIKDKSTCSHERALSVAKLAMGKRAQNAFSVSGEVDGFVSVSGKVWTVGTIAEVRIEAIGFAEPMFILERTLMQDKNGGQRCRMRLIPLGTLVLGDVPGGG